jgi:multimeric flavodoxin WrbA
MAPCRACGYCDRHGECVIDDAFAELFGLWQNAHVVIYSAPVFHFGAPSVLRAFYERLGQVMVAEYDGNALASGKPLKVVGALAQGMHLVAGQESVLMSIVAHALVMGCVPVVGDHWQSYVGAGGWTCNRLEKNALAALLAEGDEGAAAVVAASRSVARRATELALIIQSGLSAAPRGVADGDAYAPAHRLYGSQPVCTAVQQQ